MSSDPYLFQGRLIDSLWNSEEVMALNAELGLTMDQLIKLAKVIQPFMIPPLTEVYAVTNSTSNLLFESKESAQNFAASCGVAAGLEVIHMPVIRSNKT